MTQLPDHDRIETQAASWIARSEAPGWDAAEQAALDTWLDASDTHRVAWLRLRSVWRRADRLAVLNSPERPADPGCDRGPPSTERSGPVRAPADVPARAARPRRHAGWSRTLAAGLMLAALLGGALPYLLRERDTYSTPVGGHQMIPLADGSRLELNTHTHLRAKFDATRREVWLQRGEAYFEVRHDPARPFVVHAGHHRVTVLGTRFSVRRDGDRFEVVVLEGRVRLGDSIIVTTGQIAYAEPGARAALVAAAAPARVDRELSWRQGLLAFEDTPLDAVAAEFNRYNRRKLVIANEDVARIRIGGTFEADDLEAFARLLQRGFGLHAEQDADEIRITRR